jgi:hypothetical protein
MAVLRHQHIIEKSVRITPDSHAKEDALTALFDVLDVDTASEDDVDRHFHSRRLNRCRRNRRRQVLLATHAGQIEEQVCDPSAEAENADLIYVLEHKLEARQFGLLMRLANGMSYAAISIEFDVSENALRAQACRAREKAAALLAA